MSKKVEKISTAIKATINTGNYENIVYSVGIDIAGFDSESAKEVQDAINFGRELCLENVMSYYNEVKQSPRTGETLVKTTDKKYLLLEERINKSENEEQLRTLAGKVEEIKDVEMHKVMQQKFNLKLISLKNE